MDVLPAVSNLGCIFLYPNVWIRTTMTPRVYLDLIGMQFLSIHARGSNYRLNYQCFFANSTESKFSDINTYCIFDNERLNNLKNCIRQYVYNE